MINNHTSNYNHISEYLYEVSSSGAVKEEVGWNNIGEHTRVTHSQSAKGNQQRNGHWNSQTNWERKSDSLFFENNKITLRCFNSLMKARFSVEQLQSLEKNNTC